MKHNLGENFSVRYGTTLAEYFERAESDQLLPSRAEYFKEGNFSVQLFTNTCVFQDLSNAFLKGAKCKKVKLPISQGYTKSDVLEYIEKECGGDVRRLFDIEKSTDTIIVDYIKGEQVFSPFVLDRLSKIEQPLKVWKCEHIARLLANKQDTALWFINDYNRFVGIKDDERLEVIRMLTETTYFWDCTSTQRGIFITLLHMWTFSIRVPEKLTKKGWSIMSVPVVDIIEK